MKVLVFSNLVPRKTGAFEHLLVTLGGLLGASDGSLVVAFGGEPIPAAADALAANGVRWHVLRGWSGDGEDVSPWRFVLPALRLVRRERPDVAVLNFGNELPAFVVSSLCRAGSARRVRWVWQQHQRIADPTPLTRVFSRIRLLCLSFDHFVALYDGGRRSLELRGIPAERISVIYNGIRQHVRARDPGWLRRELGVGYGCVLATSVGSLIPRKRVPLQIRALACMPHLATSVHLVVVGEGSERVACEALADELGVAERVHFLGTRNDVSEILLESDLFVHTAVAEASPYVTLEAMAAGLPVVATDAGAAREQIADGESGFVVACDDVQAVAGALGRLGGDSALRSRMGAAAQRRWDAQYREDTCARRYRDLYLDLMERTDRTTS